MPESVLIALAFVVTIAGMVCCALTIDVHWRQALKGKAPSPGARVALRLGGAALLAAAFYICTKANPVSMAVLVWTMLLTVSAAVVAAAFTLLARGKAGSKA